jgi:outer membrane protein assembly factor BamB
MRRVLGVALVWAWVGGGLAGCGGGPLIPLCPQPTRHAYAIDVTAAGRVRWDTSLAVRGNGFGVGSAGLLSPLAAGAVAVFVQDDVIYGLRLADGHRLWSWENRQAVGDIWRWRGLIVVLTQLPGPGEVSLLTSLDAATGQTRWRLSVPGGIAGLGATADGGLAMFGTDGLLQVVGLSSGRPRWERLAGFPPLSAAVGMQSAWL